VIPAPTVGAPHVANCRWACYRPSIGSTASRFPTVGGAFSRSVPRLVRGLVLAACRIHFAIGPAETRIDGDSPPITQSWGVALLGSGIETKPFLGHTRNAIVSASYSSPPPLPNNNNNQTIGTGQPTAGPNKTFEASAAGLGVLSIEQAMADYVSRKFLVKKRM
jgi:hypothetical protein